MMANLMVLDVRPNPIPAGTGTTGLILIAFVVLMLSVAAIVGFVFLLRWLRRAAQASPSRTQVATRNFQPNNPNQP
jgi:hypothetical protein